MKLKQHFAAFGAAALVALTSCNNNASDTTTVNDTAMDQHTMMPGDTTMHGNMAMNNGYMPVMNKMMENMQAVPMTGDFDVDFAKTMIAHHQGAIDMAEVELAQGTDDSLKAKARDIIVKQKDEQQQLRAIVDAYKPSGMKHGEGVLQQEIQQMKSKMGGMQMTGNADKDFAALMTSHHKDGIAMGRLELEHGMSDKLKDMMKKSIDHQQKDIREFEAWMNNHQ